MSQPAPATSGERRRRADAERSIAAILDAAVEVLSERPAASMVEIASAAGVTRQTVYAHFGSREALLAAVQHRAMDEAVTAMDAAEPERGPPAAALERLIEAGWHALERNARMLDTLIAPLDYEQMQALHAPVLERLERLIRRGQRAGDFDRELSIAWTLAAVLGLFHATAQEVGAGRLGAEEAARALQRGVARMLGVEGSESD